MAVQEIPLINTPRAWQETLSIDARKYVFDFLYNRRNDTWYLTVRNSASEILLESIPCLTDVLNMTTRVSNRAFPTGEIVFADISDLGNDCTLENFGDFIRLYYLRPDPI